MKLKWANLPPAVSSDSLKIWGLCSYISKSFLLHLVPLLIRISRHYNCVTSLTADNCVVSYLSAMLEFEYSVKSSVFPT
jgi:hypothetical protein